jgi:hypothetical protein
MVPKKFCLFLPNNFTKKTSPQIILQQAEGEDELKKRQLMELAIINGTYRDSSTKAAAAGT